MYYAASKPFSMESDLRHGAAVRYPVGLGLLWGCLAERVTRQYIVFNEGNLSDGPFYF